jgi:chaperonin GroES
MSVVFQNLKNYLIAQNLPHELLENGHVKIMVKEIPNSSDRSQVTQAIGEPGIEKVEVTDTYVVVADVVDKERIVFTLDRFEVTEDRVLIRPQAVLPEEGAAFSSKEKKPDVGKVVKVGPGKRENGVMEPVVLLPGDKVLYGTWAGTPILIDNEELLVMRQADVLGYEPDGAYRSELSIKEKADLLFK